MLIVAYHDINKPSEFWYYAQKYVPRLPEAGVKRLISILPNEEMNLCTCIWEAESVEMLEQYLRSKMGDTSTDRFYRIDESSAYGLPEIHYP